MSGIFGASRWRREYGDAESLRVWESGLFERTLADIARGVEVYEREGGRVPTLAEFRRACRQYQPGTFAGAASPEPAAPYAKSLPDMMARTSEGRAWLAFCRLEGILPMGRWTADDCHDALEGRNVAAMREQHEKAGRELAALRGWSWPKGGARA